MALLPWLKHSRLTFGRSCSERADIFISLRALRFDRRAMRMR